MKKVNKGVKVVERVMRNEAVHGASLFEVQLSCNK